MFHVQRSPIAIFGESINAAGACRACAVKWSVFKRFAQVPSTSARDVLAFRASLIQVDDEPATPACCWVRQLTDEAAGYGELTRAIQVEYGYDERLLLVPEPVEIWSADFANLADFLEADDWDEST
jgi:hypothetical protein